jgi:ankyrin repeat protein
MANDYTEVKALLSRDRASKLLERNFLGQTALHLAIQTPKMLQCLIENGFSNSIDAEDRNCTTPLMYAAAYNQVDSVILLLSSGAKSNLFDKLNSLSILGYAMFRHNYDLIQKLIDDRRSVGDTESASNIINFCFWRYMVSNLFRKEDMDREGLQSLVYAGGDIGITSKRGNTLLHFAQSSGEAEALLNKTGCPINQQNHRGYTPLMVLSRFGEPMLIRRVVSEGALVNIVDNKAMSALHHLLVDIHWSTWWSDTRGWRDCIDSIATLLISGADALQADSCLCACSVFGCTPTSRLFYACTSYFGGGITLSNITWLLEWYILLKHLRSPEVLHQALAALFRFQKFEELGMTHTCCAKHKRSGFFYDENFHPSWEDEVQGAANDIKVDRTEGDSYEIMEEEEEYMELLEVTCKDFEELSENTDERKWINVLARRAVFIEEANRKIMERISSWEKPVTPLAHLEKLKVCIFPSCSISSEVLMKINDRAKRALKS